MPVTGVGRWPVVPTFSLEAEVAVSPGRGFGESGEGFLRLALIENEQRINQAVRNLKRALPKLG
jgi:alanine-synthesizing transaminase